MVGHRSKLSCNAIGPLPFVGSPPINLVTPWQLQPEHPAASISRSCILPTLHSSEGIVTFPCSGSCRSSWSDIGDRFYTLSIYTLLLQLTGDAGSVALALVLQVLPQTFGGPCGEVLSPIVLSVST